MGIGGLEGDLRRYFRRHLNEEALITHRSKIIKLQKIIAFFCRTNLPMLARIFGSDKWVGHTYCEHYQKVFTSFRRSKFNLLEIGVGGDDSLIHGGNSLRMWKAYFPKAEIIGVDIFDKSAQEEKRVSVFQGDQGNPTFLKDLAIKSGGFLIVIDDGSHRGEDIKVSFETLFPYLQPGGVYVVEDLETAYKGFNQDHRQGLDVPFNAVNYFKELIHGLNYREFSNSEYQASYFDKNVVSVQFMHNMVFIYKGDNSCTR